MTRFLNPLSATLLALGLSAGSAALAQDPAAPPAPAMPEVKAADYSYALGTQIAMQFKSQGIELDAEAFTSGLKDTLSESGSKLSDEELRNTMMAFQAQAQKKFQEKMEKQGGENLAAGKTFQDENAKRKEVTTTATGLQYEVLKAAEGDKPGPTDTVKVHYTGTLIDGTVFDSSEERGEPIEFPLNRVIKGWTEGVQLMNIGSRYRFVIPSDLAYGPQGPPAIGPNATLVFEVELLEIKTAE